MFRKKGVVFYICFTLAIVSWYSFSGFMGYDMLAMAKTSQSKEYKQFASPKHK